mmetsp:Transcript_25408/g.53557  ORF Transcript_25408/g.53557 Transcript_25408/m.53557 type:complete len:100 (+) Transcript_25408:122-421(+)
MKRVYRSKGSARQRKQEDPRCCNKKKYTRKRFFDQQQQQQQHQYHQQEYQQGSKQELHPLLLTKHPMNRVNLEGIDALKGSMRQRKQEDPRCCNKNADK